MGGGVGSEVDGEVRDLSRMDTRRDERQVEIHNVSILL